MPHDAFHPYCWCCAVKLHLTWYVRNCAIHFAISESVCVCVYNHRFSWQYHYIIMLFCLSCIFQWALANVSISPPPFELFIYPLIIHHISLGRCNRDTKLNWLSHTIVAYTVHNAAFTHHPIIITVIINNFVVEIYAWINNWRLIGSRFVGTVIIMAQTNTIHVNDVTCHFQLQSHPICFESGRLYISTMASFHIHFNTQLSFSISLHKFSK